MVGAGIAYGTQVVGNLQHNQGLGSFTHVDVQQIGKAALVGLVIGGTGGAAAGWLAASGLGMLATGAGTVGIGAGEGVLGQVGDNLLNGRSWHQDLAQAAVFGGITAGVGGAAGLAAGKAIKRFAGKVLNDGLLVDESLQASGGSRAMLGRPVKPEARTLYTSPGYNPEGYLNSIADQSGVNLRGVRIVYDPTLPVGQPGVTLEEEAGWVIRVGPDALESDAYAPNTIAHELSHARYLQKHGSFEGQIHGDASSLADGTP